MDTNQLKMVIDAVNQLGGSAQTAFYVWTLAHYLSGLVIGCMIIGGVLALASMILREIHAQAEGIARMETMRRELGFRRFDGDEMLAHVLKHCPKNPEPR